MNRRRSRSPYLRTADELTDIVAQLREIKSRPITPDPDVAGLERKLHDLIGQMLPNAVDAGTGHIFDELIDAYIAEWSAAGYRHHGAVMVDLDILNAQIEAHLAGHSHIAAADQLRVRNTEVAVQNAMDQLADDDLPTTNPVRPHSTHGAESGHIRSGR